jgi:5-enolpyruvylshikimate-3-phosphate synthase
VVTGAQELRVKESDRIAVMADGLRALGVDAQPTPDGMIVQGRGEAPAVFAGGEIASHGDHRIAMAFAMSALRASGQLLIRDTENVATSFPGFPVLATRAGVAVTETQA